ncbi:MAG: PLP-dependent transferase [Thermaerobacter sp.]|nr:PLP-dependent transferase [Thermaerobacter sp.]
MATDVLTRLVHPPQVEVVDPPTVPPLYTSTTYGGEALDRIDGILGGREAGFQYSRQGNPTVAALEGALADLEEASWAVVVASGMAAIAAALEAAVPPGALVLAAQELYGATDGLLSTWRDRGRITLRRAPVGNLDEFSAAIQAQRPAVVFVESASNPLLRAADVPALADAVHRVQGRLVVDNTFLSPLVLAPVALGADVVVESLTKFVGGHGDVTAGVVAGVDPDLARAVLAYRTHQGAAASPFDAWLAARGLKTLGLRVERQMATASVLARRLAAAGLLTWYPGLPSHPDHATAARLWRGGFGALVSVDLPGGRSAVDAAWRAFRLWGRGTTLGDVESLALYPAVASHRGLSADERLARGIGPGLVRLSVGIEGVEDLWTDLATALGVPRRPDVVT